MAEYPAVTVYQPYASLIAIGAKPREYRSYAAPERYHGQRIAIHAAGRLMRSDEVDALLVDLREGSNAAGLVPLLAIPLLEEIQWRFTHSGPPIVPCSAVVCTAMLGKPKRGLGTNTAWGWPLTDIERIRGPYPHVRGHQGWWHWQDHRTQ